MSKILGTTPEPRIVSVEQAADGLSRLVISYPMVLGTSGGASYPIPQQIQLPKEFGFKQARGKQDASGNWSWEVTCEGGPVLTPGGSGPENAGKEADLIEYAFEPSDIDVPITSHPDILRLIDLYGGSVEDGRVVFRDKAPKVNSGNSVAAKDLVSKNKKNKMFGVEAYTSFAGTWSKSYILRKGDALGDIFTDVERIIEKPPMPDWITFSFGARNWLKRMPKWRVVGTCLSISERYWLSGLGGHNDAVYTGAQSGEGPSATLVNS